MGQHTSPARQRALVAAWRQSNLSAARFARAHAIHPGTFGNWIRKHPLPPTTPRPATPPTAAQLTAPPTERADFVEVRAAAEPSPFTIRIGQHELGFHAPPPPRWLAQLIGALPSC